MAKNCYLKNEGEEDFDQVVKGKHYVIKKGEQIKLNRREAINVRGHYAQKKNEKGRYVKIDVNLKVINIPEEETKPDAAQPLEAGFEKRLKSLEAALEASAKPTKLFTCLCGKDFTAKTGLISHMKTCEVMNVTSNSVELSKDKV